MSRLTQAAQELSREEGHGGAALTTLLGVGAGAAIVTAFAADSDIAGIIGGVLVAIAIFFGVQAPHVWLRRVYPRLDKLDPADPESQPENKRRIEF